MLTSNPLEERHDSVGISKVYGHWVDIRVFSRQSLKAVEASRGGHHHHPLLG
jgi:hypothetical protein